MDSSLSQSQNVDQLTQLLRHHGFFEAVVEEAVPIVSHIFSDYVALKASVQQLKGELVDLKEENNQLRLRVAELEDYQKDPEIKGFPPQPEPFPMRRQVPIYAEHAAMEEELDALRKHMAELQATNAKLKSDGQKVRAELQFTAQQNEQLTKQVAELQDGLAKSQSLKPSKSSSKVRQNAAAVQQAQVNPDFTGAGVANNYGANAGLNQPVVQPAQSTSVTRSSVLSVASVQQVNSSAQTDEQPCFQCSVYVEEIRQLRERQSSAAGTAGGAGISTLTQQELQQASREKLQLQQLLDQRGRELADLQARLQAEEGRCRGMREREVEAETTAATAQLIHRKLEERLQKALEDSLEKKQEILQLKEALQDMGQNLAKVTQQKVKAEKTLQKMAALAEEQKCKLKLGDATISRLDAANQTMSQYLSRLSLENQRLKQQVGVDAQ